MTKDKLKSSLLSRWLFRDVTPLIQRGRQRPLQVSDFPELEDDLRSEQSEIPLRSISDPRPMRLVWKWYWNSGPSAKINFGLIFVRLPLGLLGPFILHLLLTRLGDPTSGGTALAALSIALALTVILDGVVVQHYYLHSLRTYQRITSGLNMRVFRRALVVPRATQLESSTGDWVNHLSSDTEGIAESAFFFSEILLGILTFVGSCAMLVHFLGKAALIAILFAVALAPLTRIFAKRFQKTDEALWKFRDQRVTLMSQILNGIRLVKSYAWESSVVGEVNALRAKELASSWELTRNEAKSTLFSLGASLSMALVAFAAFVALGGKLGSELIFPCILIFNQIDMPLANFPHWLKHIIHAKVAAERLTKFFGGPTIQDQGRAPLGEDPQACGVEIHGVELVLGGKNILTGVDLRVAAGESVAIVGEVGSGKTSLLMSILGETALASGTISGIDHLGGAVALPAKIGWAPQEPYILNSSVRENILIGGSTYGPLALEELLADCALIEDLIALPAGLDTEIGERGVNLSGGQKQRIALARLAALSPSLILLDDPLSAVDPTTEKVLLEKLILGRWKGRTRLVVTHRLGVLSQFDRVIFVQTGKITAQGPLEHLRASSPEFNRFYQQHLLTSVSRAESSAQELGSKERSDLETTNAPKTAAASDGSTGQLILAEDRQVGAVPTRLYWDYFLSLGGQDPSQRFWILSGLTGISLAVVALPILQSRWIGHWADLQKLPRAHTWLKTLSPAWAVAMYGLVGLVGLLAIFGERMAWTYRAIDSCAQIHSDTLHSILRSPVRFFDTTPVGRIINRFSRDLQGVDDELSWSFRSTVGAGASMIGTLILLVSVVPVLLVVIAPALWVFYRVQRDYRTAAREAKRLESISRSPRFAHFKETLAGLPVVRALGLEEVFVDKMVDHLEHYARMYWGSILINRWFSTRVPILSGVIALSTTLAAVYGVRHGYWLPGVAGLLMTYAMSFWGQLNWSVRSFSEVESRMTSYERLRTYAQLPAEREPMRPQVPPATWPEIGEIRFEHVFARYSPELPDVLEDMTFTLPAKAKVGIVGRTGSGKSSLIQALFKFLEPRSGRIWVDGYDLAQVPSERLRKAFSIIPQDPMLFIGTIRSNLDRFRLYSDEQIWASLKRVKMDATILALGGLDAAVKENGYNFSQGQRQLLCLARALLYQSRMIILDEATASMDVVTDAAIQETIRTEFDHATVLIVAHRLNSIVHCDWILEMNQGRGELVSKELLRKSIALDPVPQVAREGSPQLVF